MDRAGVRWTFGLARTMPNRGCCFFASLGNGTIDNDAASLAQLVPFEPVPAADALRRHAKIICDGQHRVAATHAVACWPLRENHPIRIAAPAHRDDEPRLSLNVVFFQSVHV